MKSTIAALLASTSLLAACGDDPDYDATFSGADDAHLMRAVQVGLGTDGFLAMFLGAAYGSLADAEDPPACPSVEIDGDATVIVGGCTLDDGTRIDGELRLENVPPLFIEDPSYDESKPTVLTFDAFSTTEPSGEVWYFDGTVRLENDSEKIVLDLETELSGIAAHADMTLICEGSCAPADGASIFVDGIGLAEVSGEWTLEGETSSGTLTLSGKEVFEIDLAQPSNECISYSIDGEIAGEICGEPESN